MQHPDQLLQLREALNRLAGATISPKVAAAIEWAAFTPVDASLDPAAFAVMVHHGYSFQAERLADILSELHPLHVEQWQETEQHRHAIEFKPDYERGIAHEKAGTLVQFTIRQGAELVGHMRLYLPSSLHTSSRFAQEDTLYIRPAHRGGQLGLAFLRYIEAALLASIGINTVGLDTNIGQFGNMDSGNGRIAVAAYAYGATALYGQAVTGSGVIGASTSGAGVLGTVSGASPAVSAFNSGTGAGVQGATSGSSGPAIRGIAGSGPGVHGSAASGYGGLFAGNASSPPLFLQPGNLGNATTGGISIVETGTDLGIVPVYAKAGIWYRFCDNRVYNSPTGDATPGGGGGGA